MLQAPALVPRQASQLIMPPLGLLASTLHSVGGVGGGCGGAPSVGGGGRGGRASNAAECEQLGCCATHGGALGSTVCPKSSSRRARRRHRLGARRRRPPGEPSNNCCRVSLAPGFQALARSVPTHSLTHAPDGWRCVPRRGALHPAACRRQLAAPGTHLVEIVTVLEPSELVTVPVHLAQLVHERHSGPASAGTARSASARSAAARRVPAMASKACGLAGEFSAGREFALRLWRWLAMAAVSQLQKQQVRVISMLRRDWGARPLCRASCDRIFALTAHAQPVEPDTTRSSIQHLLQPSQTKPTWDGGDGVDQSCFELFGEALVLSEKPRQIVKGSTQWNTVVR